MDKEGDEEGMSALGILNQTGFVGGLSVTDKHTQIPHNITVLRWTHREDDSRDTVTAGILLSNRSSNIGGALSD